LHEQINEVITRLTNVHSDVIAVARTEITHVNVALEQSIHRA